MTEKDLTHKRGERIKVYQLAFEDRDCEGEAILIKPIGVFADGFGERWLVRFPDSDYPEQTYERMIRSKNEQPLTSHPAGAEMKDHDIEGDVKWLEKVFEAYQEDPSSKGALSDMVEERDDVVKQLAGALAEPGDLSLEEARRAADESFSEFLRRHNLEKAKEVSTLAEEEEK
ncbi:hypothetical protein ES703_04162 [subsurface metagenome]|nr:hypothetical protein [bacterium]